MNEQQPATKADLQQLKTELLEAVRAMLDGRLDTVEERLKAHVRQVTQEAETKLLAAFFTYQEHEKIQFQRLKADTGNATRAAELRLDNLEQRVIELEKRFLMGGSPQ